MPTAAEHHRPRPAQTWGPPPPPPQPRRDGAPHRPWRERLPELVATVGAILVVAAIAGFVTSTWDDLEIAHKAMALAAVAVGLTVAGVYVDTARQQASSRVVGLVLLCASVAVGASVTLFGYAAAPGSGRLAILAGGLAAALHAGWVLARDPASPTRVLGLAAALAYAAGPSGSALADRFSTMDPAVLLLPVRGVLDPTVTSDHLMLLGTGWSVVGVVLLFVATRLAARARHTAVVVATVALFAAAAMLNIATDPLGAFAALCIVVGYLLYGIVADRPGISTTGAIGVLVAGIRVVWGLFSGQVAVTVTALAVGVAMLAWAVHAVRGRSDAATRTHH